MTVQEHARQLIQPVSHRYDRYDARIRALGRKLAFLRRHWVLIITLSCVILALIMTLLFLLGSFFNKAQCQDFIYGDDPACDAKAFWAPTNFEYATLEGEPIWQSLIPSEPGQYRIRGVSRNAFGTKKHSNEMPFTLLPRVLTLTIPSGGVRYGDLTDAYLTEHTQAEGLATGDEITEFNWNIQFTEGQAVTVQLVSIRITDPHGRDVTKCYQIQASEQQISLLPRALTVSAPTKSIPYDGTNRHGDLPVSIKTGSLAAGDRLEAYYENLPCDAGEYELLPVCKILNSIGEDVTYLYQLNTWPGTLTITPQELFVTTGSAEKVYDATPLSLPDWELASGSLIPGHHIESQFTVSLTKAGTKKNIPFLYVYDEEGTDVTHNYKINLEPGTLTIHPIVLKFRTGSAEKVYDGTYLYCQEYELLEGAVLPHHELVVYTSGSQLLAGTSANTLKVHIMDGRDDLTRECYKIEVDTGTLTVTKRELTFRSGSAEKLYDGYPLVCFECSLISGSLAPGDTIEWVDFSGEQTEVGKSSNTFHVGIKSGALYNTMATLSYRIHYEKGTLTVHPNPDYVPPKEDDDDDKQNDSDKPNDHGQHHGAFAPDQFSPISFPGGNYPGYNTTFAIVTTNGRFYNGQQVYFRAGSYGNYTGYGWEPANTYSYDFSPLEFAGRAIYREAQAQSMHIELRENCSILFPYYSRVFYNLGGALSASDVYFEKSEPDYNEYSVNHMSDPGYYHAISHTLTNENDMLAEFKYRDFVYSNYMDVPYDTRQALMAWAEDQGISHGSATLVEDIQQAVMNSAYYNMNAEAYPANTDVVVHFLTIAKEGICQHFASAATLLYRCYGIPARYTVGYMTPINGDVTEILGSQAHAWVEIYQPGLGWVPIEVTSSSMAPSVDTKLVVQVASATKFYDGLPIGMELLQNYALEAGELLPGHRLELTYSNTREHTQPGRYYNTIKSYRILDENGFDVTDFYGKVRFIPGHLLILPRDITVASGSATKPDDGKVLTCTDYWLAQGSLVQGDFLQVETSGSIYLPGSTPNQMEVKVMRTDSWGNQIDVSEFYNIQHLTGTLTILPAVS